MLTPFVQPFNVGATLGLGAVYTNIGFMASLEARYSFLVMQLRTSRMISDDGSVPGYLLLPREEYSENALLAGFQTHTGRLYAQITGGPCFSEATLRGDSVVKEELGGFFGPATREYNVVQVRKYGYSIEGRVGLAIAPMASLGLRVFDSHIPDHDFVGAMLECTLWMFSSP